MIVLITGASHTGKTLFAQRLLERLQFPYLSIDHLKMGLLRSGQTDLTPEDDAALTPYLWPIVREIIKTAVENCQNLIVEGCYVPFDWRRDLGEPYAASVRFVCLSLTDAWIGRHLGEIRAHASDIERRLCDADLSPAFLKAENRAYREGFERAGEAVVQIDGDYAQTLSALLQTFNPA